MSFIFDLCVKSLVWAGDLFGMSYVQINVWIFCIIEPIIFIVLLVIIFRQYNTIKYLRNIHTSNSKL